VTLLFSETFEEGTNGTAITTADSNFTNFVAAGTWVFSNAHLVPGYGVMSGKSTASAGTAIANAGNTVWASKAVTYWDQAFYVESTPTSNASVVTARNGATATADLRILATGAVQLRANNVQAAVSAASIAVTGKRVRVRFKLDSGAQKVQLQVWGDANISAATPDYDSGLVTVSSLTATTDFQVGFVSSTTGILHWAGFAIDDAVFPGPSSNAPPTCSATVSPNPAAPAATVTLSGTDADSDGTIATRAWTQTSGTTVTLTGASTATATFPAPSVSGGATLGFLYTVTDNLGATATASVSVTITSSTASIAVRGSTQSTNTGLAADTTGTVPPATVVGDKLLAVFFDGGGTLTETLTASGWLAVSASAVSTANIGLHVWQKTAVSGDASSTLTVTSSVDGSTVSKRTFVVAAFVGARLGNAGATLANTAATAHVAPTQTAVSANAWVVNIFADRGSPGSTSFTLPGNLVVLQHFEHTGGAAVSSVVAYDDIVGAGTVGGNTATGTISTGNAVAATIVLEPGTGNNPPPLVAAGADQTGVEPWATVTVGGTDTARGTATVASILWEQLSGADVTASFSSTSTATITLTAPATLYGTSVLLQKTVTDSTGAVGTDLVQLDVLPVTERIVVNGVEVPLRIFRVAP
jgi:hypothetical protein